MLVASVEPAHAEFCRTAERYGYLKRMLQEVQVALWKKCMLSITIAVMPPLQFYES